MSSKTMTFKHPRNGVAPLRVNVLVALFDLNTQEVFVGSLAGRENNLRAYARSMVEGGLDEGECLSDVYRRELAEEVGVLDVSFLAALKSPLICYFDDWATAPKYSGKLFSLAAYGIEDRSKINLSSGRDKEGPTFDAARWMPLEKAEAWLLQGTNSVLRRQFTSDVVAVLEPIERAIKACSGITRQENMAQAIHQTMAPEKAALYTSLVPSIFPFPSLNDPVLRCPEMVRPIGALGVSSADAGSHTLT